MPWPDNSNYGCTADGDDWALLDAATFGKNECKSLCLQHASNDGCCFVGETLGCYWKGRATAEFDINSNGNNYAITCTTYGESYYVFAPSINVLLV